MFPLWKICRILLQVLVLTSRVAFNIAGNSMYALMACSLWLWAGLRSGRVIFPLLCARTPPHCPSWFPWYWASRKALTALSCVLGWCTAVGARRFEGVVGATVPRMTFVDQSPLIFVCWDGFGTGVVVNDCLMVKYLLKFLGAARLRCRGRGPY